MQQRSKRRHEEITHIRRGQLCFSPQLFSDRCACSRHRVAPSAVASSAAAPRPCGDVALYGHIESLTRRGDHFELRFDPAWFLSGVTASRAKLEDTGRVRFRTTTTSSKRVIACSPTWCRRPPTSPSSADGKSPARVPLDGDHGFRVGSARGRQRAGQVGRTHFESGFSMHVKIDTVLPPQAAASLRGGCSSRSWSLALPPRAPRSR